MDTIEKALKKRIITPEVQKGDGFDVPESNSTAQENMAEDKMTQITSQKIEQASTLVEALKTEPVDNKQMPNTANDIDNISPMKQAESYSSNTIFIDKKHLEEQGFLTPNDTHSKISNEFRQIKRPLLQNIRSMKEGSTERLNLIQITSSFQGEGKTFNAINIAMAMAMELDYKVLLVDADVIKPSIMRSLNVKADNGLIEYLSGDIGDLSEVMLNTNIDKLTILPAGNKHNLLTELVSSAAMDQLCDELSKRYSDRIVIIDSPPILQTNEAVLLSHQVGQIVLIVEQNTTPQADIKKTLSKLGSNAKIGIVLNKSRSGETEGYYGYGSG